MDEVFHYFSRTLLMTFQQLLILAGPALLFGFAMNCLAVSVERQAYALFGRRAYLLLFGWLGTSVHELSHALFCVLFLHRILAMKLFDPDPRAGTLGYVRHAFNPHSWYQVIGNLFIGIGPVVIGSLLVYATAKWFAGADPIPTIDNLYASPSGLQTQGMLAAFFSPFLAAQQSLASLFTLRHLVDWRFYLFAYLAFAIGGSVRLSRSDINGAARGFAAILGILIMVSLCTAWLPDDVLAQISRVLTRFSTALCSVMLFSLLLNLMALGALAIFAYLLRPVKFGFR